MMKWLIVSAMLVLFALPAQGQCWGYAARSRSRAVVDERNVRVVEKQRVEVVKEVRQIEIRKQLAFVQTPLVAVTELRFASYCPPVVPLAAYSYSAPPPQGGQLDRLEKGQEKLTEQFSQFLGQQQALIQALRAAPSTKP